MPAITRRITLLTDFGTADGYAAAMRGVLASRAPHARVEDASHDIAPGDVIAAAWTLTRYAMLYPEGTVHVAVVDPGVGGRRRALAAECDGRFFTGPDNGVLTRVFAGAQSLHIVAIENERLMQIPVSATFHGRDVFAPAAAHLATGGALTELGPPIQNPVAFEIESPERDGFEVRGAVVHIDRFGTLITNVPRSWVDGPSEVHVGSVSVGPLQASYSAVGSGQPVALIGSADLLEIAVRDGSAARFLGAGRGAAVTVRPARETVRQAGLRDAKNAPR